MIGKLKKLDDLKVLLGTRVVRIYLSIIIFVVVVLFSFGLPDSTDAGGCGGSDQNNIASEDQGYDRDYEESGKFVKAGFKKTNNATLQDGIPIITRFAGTTQGFSGDGGSALSAQISSPRGMAFDSEGNLYVADSGNRRIRKISVDGIISTTAGNGELENGPYNGPATLSGLLPPNDIAINQAGDLFVTTYQFAQGGYSAFQQVRKITAVNNIMTHFAGKSVDQHNYGNQPFGDGGLATNAPLNRPLGIVVNSNGVFIADTLHHCIRYVTYAGIISTFAGKCSDIYYGYSGDNGQATNAKLGLPTDITLDSNGNLLIADAGHRRIRKITNGIITTFAGTGGAGSGGDGGQANQAFLTPTSITSDFSGNLYLFDNQICRIRKINSQGIISRIAGSDCEFSGFAEGGDALQANFLKDTEIAVNAGGYLFVSDSARHKIWKISFAGQNQGTTNSGSSSSTQSSGDQSNNNQQQQQQTSPSTGLSNETSLGNDSDDIKSIELIPCGEPGGMSLPNCKGKGPGK